MCTYKLLYFSYALPYPKFALVVRNCVVAVNCFLMIAWATFANSRVVVTVQQLLITVVTVGNVVRFHNIL